MVQPQKYWAVWRILQIKRQNPHRTRDLGDFGSTPILQYKQQKIFIVPK